MAFNVRYSLKLIHILIRPKHSEKNIPGDLQIAVEALRKR